jgi:hypothetical protein
MKLAAQLAFTYGVISLSVCVCFLVWFAVDVALEAIGFRVAPKPARDWFPEELDDAWLEDERQKFLLIVGGTSERVH